MSLQKSIVWKVVPFCLVLENTAPVTVTDTFSLHSHPYIAQSTDVHSCPSRSYNWVAPYIHTCQYKTLSTSSFNQPTQAFPQYATLDYIPNYQETTVTQEIIRLQCNPATTYQWHLYKVNRPKLLATDKTVIGYKCTWFVLHDRHCQNQ